MNLNQRIRKVLCLILCMLLAVTMFGCQSSDGGFKAGTYTGTGQGHNGEITMEVTVDESSIKDIKVLEHKESPGISDAAFEQIPDAIINGQTLAVDTVSGATYSSNGILEGVISALTQAGGDIESLKNKQTYNETENKTVEYTTDVVIIGAGGAGLSAAVSAHENGAKVIVIEKMPKVGGNTIISGSAFNAVDPSRQEAQGIEDSIDKHFTQTYEGGDKSGDTALIKVLVENAYPTIEWLESMGMEFKDDVFTVLGGLWPRAHKPVKPLGTGYIDAYMGYIEKNNSDIEILLDTKATEFIMEDNAVVGVKAEGKNGSVIVKANKGVVLAAGGFGANSEMRDQYDNTWNNLTDLKTTNHPGATGDGVVMAESIGAKLVGMEYIQLLPMGDPDTGSLSGNIEQGVENRIFINENGNRFTDEGGRRDDMTRALLEQENQHMWIVLDKHSYPTGDTYNNFHETIDDLVAAGRAYKADTIEDLAKQIGVDPDNLVEAIEKFNKAVEVGTDEYGRKLFDQKIDTAPFYAGERVPTVHHTMGGVQINTDTQVLDANGEIIPGLFAAGEVTGGIHGKNRLGGNALADVNTFGRIAGRNVATFN